MEIKILGPGGANCQDMERRVKQALQEEDRSKEVSNG